MEHEDKAKVKADAGDLGSRIAGLLQGRPWWMNALMLFCGFMAVVYVPWDLFIKPVERDQEVWFGFVLEGWAAKVSTPLHWAIYAAGFVGFLRMRSWMHPWAALYVLQIAVGMLVWSWLDERGHMAMGLVSFVVFAGIAWVLWNARAQFGNEAVVSRG